MGNSFCQCKSLCLWKKEENLTSPNLSKAFNYNLKKSRNKVFINPYSTFRSSETIQSIYRKNCAKKIIKNYLKYKKSKMKNFNDDLLYIDINNNKKEDDISTSRNDIEQYNNIDQYSINHPFYVDKIHKSKTIYEKVNIPKINNGKSLEMLNRNSSDCYIIKENNDNYKKKK